MRKLQRIAVAVALAAAGLGVAGAAANATTAAPGHSTQEAAASWDGGASVRANERVVEAFLQDVVNEHNGDHAANYLNPDSPTRTSPSMTSSVSMTRSWCAWS